MVKHNPERMTLSEIIDRIDAEGANFEWYDVLGIEIPGLLEAHQRGEEDGWGSFSEIEYGYLKSHMDDVYLVAWPEHVVVARINHDASYQPVEADHAIVDAVRSSGVCHPDQVADMCIATADAGGNWQKTLADAVAADAAERRSLGIEGEAP